MGKRSKEKRLAEFAGRRKQTIQLGGFSRSQQASAYNPENYQYADYTYTSNSPKVSGIQLLGSYQEESDNDSGTEGPTAIKSDDVLSHHSTKQLGHQMEDQLAGFLAEINAIDTTSVPMQASNEPADTTVYDPLDFDPFTQGHLLPAPWQAVLDESSGYHYYWNCETNEVQWEPPPAPAVQGCPLPEPPPPPLTDDNADKDENGIEQEQGLDQEALQVSEEEERRKAMSAKVAGLSKKERIKLLLEMNKMNVKQRPSEETGVGESTMVVNSEASSEVLVGEKSDESSTKQISEKEKCVDGQGQKPLLGLVSGYDSDASDSDGDSESVSKDDGIATMKGELPSKEDVNSDIALSAGSQLSSEALSDMEALFKAADNLAVYSTDTKSDSRDNRTEIDVGEEKKESSNETGEIGLDPASGVEQGDLERTEEDGDLAGNDRSGKEDDDMESEHEELIETSRYDADSEDVGEPVAGVEASCETGPEEVSSSTDKKVDEASIDAESKIEETDNSTKKEFSVDIFAEESDHEHDKEAVKLKLSEEDKMAEDGSQPDFEENGDEIVQAIDEGKKNAAEEDVPESKHNLKDADKKRRSKHKEKKKPKKEKKEKKKKDHERKHRDSDKKRRDDKSDKRSKRHSEKSHNSSKSTRSSKEDVRDDARSKKKEELTEDEKLKIEEKKRKNILEEIEKEERRRDEYERLKKEEKERKEEGNKRLETEKKLQKDKEKEEEKLKEEEMNDFAEMLLEGALDGEKPSGDAETETKVEEPVEEDMEISDTDENSGRPPLPPMPPPDDDQPFKEQAWRQNDDPSDKYYEEMQTRITDLSLLLFDKLEFLEVSKKGLTNFQVMFIELETRMHDWREGALSNEYLLYKLEEIDAEIYKYEESAAPDGWNCHWSSEYGMYYYYCEATGESTWSYPAGKGTDDKTNDPVLTYGPAYQTTEDTGMPSAPNAAPLDNYGYGRTNMMMWRSEFVENEKKDEDKTEAKKTVKSDPYRDPYRNLTTKKDTAKPLPPAIETPLPPGEDDDSLQNPWDDDKRSGTSSPFPIVMPTAKSIPPAAAVAAVPAASVAAVPATSVAAVPAASVASVTKGPAVATSSLAGLTKTAVQQSDIEAVTEDSSSVTVVKAPSILSGIPRVASDSALVTLHALQAHAPASHVLNAVQPKAEKKKKEKRKKVVGGGLPSKKLKTVSSLVQKWQQVKQKVDEELMENSSEDEDPNVLSQKRIEEWKKAQLESGRAAYNPNFEEIKGDWREKIKKKHQ